MTFLEFCAYRENRVEDGHSESVKRYQETLIPLYNSLATLFKQEEYSAFPSAEHTE